MKKLLVRLSVVGLVSAMAVACGQRDEPVQLEPIDNVEKDASTVNQPASPALASNGVDSLSRRFASAPYNTQSGELVEGDLVNDGRAGYLLFGPYVAFQSGTYTAEIKGEVLALPPGSRVRLDAASEKGRTVHDRLDVHATGLLPTLEFTLKEPVEDLELRVLAPEGSRVSLESYEIVRVQ